MGHRLSSQGDDPPSQPGLVARDEAGEQAFGGMHALARRSLVERYGVVFFDKLLAKLRRGDAIEALAIWFAIGVRNDGRKDVLGMWLPSEAGAVPWHDIVSDLIYRGVSDVLIAVVPPDDAACAAVKAGFSAIRILPGLQWASGELRSIVPGRDRPALFGRLRTVMLEPGEDLARGALDEMARGGGDEAACTIAGDLAAHWTDFVSYFSLSPAIRDVLCVDTAKTLSDKLSRRSVKLPVLFRDRETALITTSHMVALAATDWGVAPEKWLAARADFAAAFGNRFR